MYYIQCVIFNDERYYFNAKSRLLLGMKRSNPHFSDVGEKEYEKQFIRKMKLEGFEEKKCMALKWFRKVFPEANIKHEKLRGLAEFFAFKLGVRLGREIYRRRACLLYWFEERLEAISNLLSTSTMLVSCDSQIYKVGPPIERNQISSLQKPSIEDELDFFNSYTSSEDNQCDLNDFDDDSSVAVDSFFEL